MSTDSYDDIANAIDFFTTQAISKRNKQSTISKLKELKNNGRIMARFKLKKMGVKDAIKIVNIPFVLPMPLHSLDTLPIRKEMLSNFHKAALECVNEHLYGSESSSEINTPRRERAWANIVDAEEVLNQTMVKLVGNYTKMSNILNANKDSQLHWRAWVNEVANAAIDEEVANVIKEFGMQYRLYDTSNGWTFTHVLGRLVDSSRNDETCYAKAYHHAIQTLDAKIDTQFATILQQKRDIEQGPEQSSGKRRKTTELQRLCEDVKSVKNVPLPEPVKRSIRLQQRTVLVSWWENVVHERLMCREGFSHKAHEYCIPVQGVTLRADFYAQEGGKGTLIEVKCVANAFDAIGQILKYKEALKMINRPVDEMRIHLFDPNLTTTQQQTEQLDIFYTVCQYLGINVTHEGELN